MKGRVRVFDSKSDAEAADDAYYSELTPAQRLEILFELVADYRESVGEAAEGFARVCRVVDRERG